MEIRQRSMGPVLYLDLKGRFVLDQEEALKDIVANELSQGRREFVLNLKDVTAMDTSGLSAMIWVKQTVSGMNGAVKLRHLPSRIRDLLVVTRLVTLFDVIDGEDDPANLVRAVAS
jgi:anti-sigma B factor antagonist